MTYQDYPASHTPCPVARFSGELRYRIDGDRVQLGAEVAILDPQSFGHRRCLLQLWACDSRFDGGLLQGVKVAECPLDIQGTTALFAEEHALALPPAGQGDYAIVLTLVAVDACGAVQLHDYVNFDNRQAFTQPMLLGEVQCDLGAKHADLTVERILNPRAANNLSGSLCLELWALPEPYRGGAFSGTLLAATELGTLCGGFEWLYKHCRLDLSGAVPGDASLVLMLREWTQAGRLTRDYRVLSLPATATQAAAESVGEAASGPERVLAAEVQAQAELLSPEPDSAQLLELQSGVPERRVAESPAETAPAADRMAADEIHCAAVVVCVESAAITADAGVSAEAAEAAEVAEVAEVAADIDGGTAAPASAEAAAVAPAASLVSINSASAQELARIKGISARLASAIISGRPYGSLDTLIQVRGIGKLTLERFRPFLGL
ncbi:ComEA family DNA-binding protein [Marinobacterium sedimentorum]|uniref:ComEA family DNA-binding protein n=1 Tax=Marinobacterium sedimentorum TaxID=2927804 RepID=UPI0020C692DC|nr:helix-hairpin-helix domain-containing protein [Marinobacterium sedimentorum]MCP8689602.1 helix-hairpin-helix domain-containing protein [Marinobacterium sedimentorum]